MQSLPKNHRAHQRGFTMIELGITLIVLSFMIGALLTILTHNIRQQKMAETNRRMDAIERALVNYVATFGNLPCPASMESMYATGLGQPLAGGCNYGGSVYTAGLTAGSIVNTPASGTLVSTINYMLSGGFIPATAIGLTPDYIYDAWGNAFLYVVDINATNPNATTNCPPNSIATSVTMNSLAFPVVCGRIDVGSTATGNLTFSAAVVLISFGPDGFGSIQADSGRPKAGTSVNGYELINCHCNTDGTASTFYNYFVQGDFSSDPANVYDTFDDIVRYYPWDYFLPKSARLTEKPF